MWTRSYSVVTKEVTKEQLWKLFADVNNWHTWTKVSSMPSWKANLKRGITLCCGQRRPNVKVELLETIENKHFLDVTSFPLAKMYDDIYLKRRQKA